MIEHYLHLLDKPEWQLTSSDKMFVDVFPYLVIGAVLILMFVIWYVVAGVRAWWKKRYKKKHPCKYCKRGHQCVGCPVKVVRDKEVIHD